MKRALLVLLLAACGDPAPALHVGLEPVDAGCADVCGDLLTTKGP